MSGPAQGPAKPHFTVTVDGGVHGEDTLENREIARRIRACVNACEGISTEELEQGVVQDMRRVLNQVVPLLQERIEQSPPDRRAAS